MELFKSFDNSEFDLSSVELFFSSDGGGGGRVVMEPILSGLEYYVQNYFIVTLIISVICGTVVSYGIAVCFCIIKFK